LVIDFVNLKIKSAHSFKCVYRDRIRTHVFIEVSGHIYMSICISIISKKPSPKLYQPSPSCELWARKGPQILWHHTEANLILNMPVDLTFVDELWHDKVIGRETKEITV
jgi:hypothetical protein